TIKKRLEWRDIDANIINYNIGDEFPASADIVLGGGGQDSGQQKIATDLQQIAGRLHNLAASGTPMLMVCGLYQLIGRSFTTADGSVIPGIDLVDITTVAGPE